MVSRLLYGLETIPLTTAMETKINAFQQRCLRRILKIDPAYYSRVKNIEVLAKANKTVSKLKRTQEDWVDQLAKGDLTRAPIKPLATILAQRRVKLFAHTLRHEDDELPSDAFLRGGQPRNVGYRRVGRPKFSWAKQAGHDAWEQIREEYHLEGEYKETRDQFNVLWQAAMLRDI